MRACSSLAMCTAAEVSGAASVSPTIPNRAAGADRDDEYHERVEAQCRAHHEWLDHLLENAVREQGDERHDRRVGRAAGAQCHEHREAAGDPGADEGHVGPHERDDRDRPRERHTEDQRRAPDQDGVERGDDRHGQEVAAQRLGDVGRDEVGRRFGHAHVPVDEAVHDRPVLEYEQCAQRRESEEEHQRLQPLDARRDSAQ